MNERLKFLRKKLNLSQEAFGNKLGVTGAGISRIESGTRSITEQMILFICREFNVNEKWLRNGIGEMFNNETNNILNQFAEQYNFDEFDKKIIFEYSQLDVKKRAVIKDYILSITNNNNNNNNIINSNSITFLPNNDNQIFEAEDSDIEQELESYRKELITEKENRISALKTNIKI